MQQEYQARFSTLFLALNDKQNWAIYIWSSWSNSLNQKWSFHLGNCKSISNKNLRVKCCDTIPKLESPQELLTID